MKYLTNAIIQVVVTGIALLSGIVASSILDLPSSVVITLSALLFIMPLLVAIKVKKQAHADYVELAANVYKQDYALPETSSYSKLEQLRRPLLSAIASLSEFGNEIRTSSDILEDTFDYFVRIVNEILSALGKIDEDMTKQQEAVETTSSTVIEMVSSIDSVSSNIESQSSSVIELSSILEEMISSINNITGTAQQAQEITDTLSMEATKGNESINDTIKSINAIQDSSSQIGEIISVIAHIARRTNLLAMNAAIEAAHAGDAGKGFAVVADEIRNLAEKSNDSAKQIEELIREVVQKIQVSVDSGEAISKVFDKILEDISDTKNIVMEITNAMQEQSTGSNEILKAVENLVDITEKIRGSMSEQQQANKEINGVVANLETIAEHVREITNDTQRKRFKLLDAVNLLGRISVRNYDIAYKFKKQVAFKNITEESKND
jgi:methyl-accepting chemotaxis protein